MPFFASGVQCDMNGAFTCRIRVKTNGHETELSRTLQVGKAASWTYEELIAAGESSDDRPAVLRPGLPSASTPGTPTYIPAAVPAETSATFVCSQLTLAYYSTSGAGCVKVLVELQAAFVTCKPSLLYAVLAQNSGGGVCRLQGARLLLGVLRH